MTKKSISTNMSVVACDICGRTLLRGEHADVFLAGGARRTVCELCTSRAVHEGWIREGVDDPLARNGAERRGARSLLGRLRQRRGGRDDDFREPLEEPVAHDPSSYDPDLFVGGEGPEAPAASPAPRQPVAPPGADAAAERAPREPRHVHAIPSNSELKVGRALEVFNVSPHRRTVAGVARSLGAPIVTALPSATEGAIVSITVAWELSWYRYEVDLGDEASGVRVVAQGTELDELPPGERAANAIADEQGGLHPAAQRQ
jgi:hypothetical protein